MQHNDIKLISWNKTWGTFQTLTKLIMYFSKTFFCLFVGGCVMWSQMSLTNMSTSLWIVQQQLNIFKQCTILNRENRSTLSQSSYYFSSSPKFTVNCNWPQFILLGRTDKNSRLRYTLPPLPEPFAEVFESGTGWIISGFGLMGSADPALT